MKSLLAVLVICCAFFLKSSNVVNPETYLDVAVLNSTVVEGFAGTALSVELENTKSNRQILIKNKINASEKILEVLKQMKETPEVKDILSTSIGLHEFVIEVYKTDYMTLAKLYDEGATKLTINYFDRIIKEKHGSMFLLHYENLVRGGKLFAAKNHIKVNWNDRKIS